MIPQTVYYSQQVKDKNGIGHEIGMSGLIEEGETFEEAHLKVVGIVEKNTQNFTVDFENEVLELKSNIVTLENEISNKLENISSFTKFAELRAMDFSPPSPDFSSDYTEDYESLTEQVTIRQNYLDALDGFSAKNNLIYDKEKGYMVVLPDTAPVEDQELVTGEEE